MKRILEYESETVLPREVAEILETYYESVLAICREGDKLDCYLGSMRHALIVWFADNSEEASL